MKPHSVGQYKLTEQYGEFEKDTMFTVIYINETRANVYVNPSMSMYVPANILEKVK